MNEKLAFALAVASPVPYGVPRGAIIDVGPVSGGKPARDRVVFADFIPNNWSAWPLNELNDPPIKSLYVYTSNPAAVAPEQNQVLKGLAREDLFTVVHERFMTDTARYADIVLPSTSSLEHSDLYRSYGTYCIQRAKTAIPPVGESKSNWQVFCLLAQGMGFKEPFFRQTADDLIEHLLSIPNPMRDGIDQEAFSAGKAVEVPLPADGRTRFRTISGKIEILNPREPHPLPCYLPPHEMDYPFRLMTAPSLYCLNSSRTQRPPVHRESSWAVWSPVAAYAVTGARPDAVTWIESLRGDLVIAFRQLGSGRVVAITSGLGAWTGEWMRWSRWPEFAGGLADWVARGPSHSGNALQVTEHPGRLSVHFDSAAAGEWVALEKATLLVRAPSGQQDRIRMQDEAPGRVGATVIHPEPGLYEFMVPGPQGIAKAFHLHSGLRANWTAPTESGTRGLGAGRSAAELVA